MKYKIIEILKESSRHNISLDETADKIIEEFISWYDNKEIHLIKNDETQAGGIKASGII